METVISVIAALNSMSPLAIIGLLGFVIFTMVKARKEVSGHVNTIKTNDLHELPSMAEDLRNIAASMQRIEVKLGEDFGYIKARLNGGERNVH